MNIPSRPDDNWTWRLDKKAITPELAKKIAELIDVADRDPLGSRLPDPGNGREQEEFAA
jgi:hypothetical protein